MITITRLSLYCVLIVLSQYLFAGDEDMNPSVYQKFDPDTGYMIPIDPPATTQSNHASTPDVNPTNTNNSVVAPKDTVIDRSQDQSRHLLVPVGISTLLLITGVAVFLIRKNRVNN